MKEKLTILLGLAAATVFTASACDKHRHGDGEKGHSHEHGHDHGKKAGPNGGRVMHEFEPHVEFFVLEDRKVRLTFLGENLKPVPAGTQEARVIAGSRLAPTRLGFTKVGDVLVSDKALPATDNFPVVVQISPAAGAKKVSAKFQADMRDCPTCDYLEYACVCDHEHDHDHKHE